MLRLKILVWTLAAPFAMLFGPARAFLLFKPSQAPTPSSNENVIESLIKEADGILLFRVFGKLLFRTRCLKRSLVLYRLLRSRGHDAVACVGFQRVGDELRGHAWIKIGDKIIPDAQPNDNPCITFYEIGEKCRALSGV